MPINVILLFSREHYLATAEAYLRGVERRIAAGRKPNCRLRASLSVSCWDVADRHIGGDRLQERYPHAGPVMLGRRKAYAERRR